jgi:UDP-2,3-diacylglucosamine hydrolase
VRRANPASDPGSLREILFISDLHLSPDRPGTVDLFLNFLAARARQAQRLYILGDLFDAWIGDDDDSPPSPAACAALRGLTQAGTACGIMHGNRDFLIGRRFARDTGCTLLKDPTLIDLGRTPTLLMHGDLLCTDDVAYQRFRRRIRNPLIQRLVLWRSLASRRAIAADYRSKSGAATAKKPETIMDVNADTVKQYLTRYGAENLVHGHTHRPADHRLDLPSGLATRRVLAEWHPDRGEALVWCDGEWRREAITQETVDSG